MSTRTTPESLAARVQELTESLDSIGDPFARTLAEELAAAMVDLYGEGLVRIFAALDDAGPPGAAIRDQLTEDGVVASLMLVHDLYPVALEERVIEALDTVRPYMESHGGNVELLGIEDGVARLRLEGSCHGCAASAQTLELAIKNAIEETAPDLVGLEVEGVVEPPPRKFKLAVVHSDDGAAAAPPTLPFLDGGTTRPVPPVFDGATAPVADGGGWVDLDGVASGLDSGDTTVVTVSTTALLLANVNGTLLAYRDRCAGCGEPLHGGDLRGGVLSCPACQRRFYLPNAGRSVDHDRLQLDPVPLLAQPDGGIRIALAT